MLVSLSAQVSHSKNIKLSLVGVGAYMLSREGDTTKFDPNIHTKAKLHDLLEDIYLEYACGYIFFYNMILNLKESGQLDIESVKAKIENYTSSIDEKVAKKHNITNAFLRAWMEKEKNDA